MIKGKKIVLRALEKNDLRRCWKWINNSEVTRDMGTSFPKSMHEEERWYEEIQKSERRKVFAIQVGKKHVGNISLENIDYRSRKATLGIMIGEQNYWNKGYGSDAVKTLLLLAFNELNLHKIYLHVFPSNKRAIKCYRKCRFKEDGRLKDHVFKAGKYHDLLVMGVINKGEKR